MLWFWRLFDISNQMNRIPTEEISADNGTIFACHFLDEVQLVYREELSRTICSHP